MSDICKIQSHTDLQQIVNRNKTVLIVFKILRCNKAHQDALLPHLESVVLPHITATTENPFYSLVNPLLSRSQLFELYPLTVENVKQMLERAIADEKRGLGYIGLCVQEDALIQFEE